MDSTIGRSKMVAVWDTVGVGISNLWCCRPVDGRYTARQIIADHALRITCSYHIAHGVAHCSQIILAFTDFACHARYNI
jgi:hypothetical protein